jgi:16S rRNA (guanine(966)-N(2))-methyltransferase RsmD
MRIISGKYGGRRISPPANMPHTRPTTDIAKEGLFNILQSRMSFDDIEILDLFGGTGCISYELASRGAGKLTIIEKDPIMQAFIQKNIGMLNIEGAQVLKLDVFAYLNSCTSSYDFIFAGPPYALGTIDELPKIIVEKKLINPGGFFVLEHTPRNDYKNFEGYSFQRNYGTTIFSFFVAT